jgi:hypothetical protein
MGADSTSSLLGVLGAGTSSAAYASCLALLQQAPASLERSDYLRPAPATSYRNARAAGVSFQFQADGTAPTDEAWRCTAIDVYNAEAQQAADKRKRAPQWGVCPLLPLRLELRDIKRPSGAETSATAGSLDVTATSTGGDFVAALGEPSRKGGGEALAAGGASGLGPGAWLEWEGEAEGRRVTLMVELVGEGAKGAGRWEKDKAGKAMWGVLTIALVGQP